MTETETGDKPIVLAAKTLDNRRRLVMLSRDWMGGQWRFIVQFWRDGKPDAPPQVFDAEREAWQCYEGHKPEGGTP